MTINSTEPVCFMDRKSYICNFTVYTDINYTANALIYEQSNVEKVWLNQFRFNLQYYSTSLQPLVPFFFTWQHYDSILTLFGERQNKIAYVFFVLIPLALIGVYITYSVILTKY